MNTRQQKLKAPFLGVPLRHRQERQQYKLDFNNLAGRYLNKEARVKKHQRRLGGAKCPLNSEIFGD